MVILLIATILSFLSLLFSTFECIDCHCVRKDKLKKRLVFACVCLLMFISSFGAMLFSEMATSFGAERVAFVYNEKQDGVNEVLFFDHENGEYFVVKEKLLNPFEPTYRLHLDTETVEKYLELYNSLHKIELY